MRSVQALLVAVLVVAAATLPAESADVVWTPIPPRSLNSLVNQQVAKFAVLFYNMAHRKTLVFVTIVSGKTSRTAAGGTDYQLVLIAKSSPTGSNGNYQCVVIGTPGSRSNTWQLLSFKGV